MRKNVDHIKVGAEMKKITLLLFGMFALGVDAYVMAGILPLIAADFGVSIGTAGQSVSAFTLCYAIAAPLFAAMMSRTNTKHILIAALSMFTLANMMTAVTQNFAIFLLSRGIAGIGAGLYSPLASSAAVHLASEQHRGRALSLILFGMSAGTVIGVPLGIYISSLHNWRLTMWSIVCVGLIGIIAIASRFPEIRSNSLPTLSDRLSMFKNKQITLVMLVTAILSFCSLGLYTYLDQIISAFEYEHSIWFIWLWGLGGIAGSFFIGSIMDRYKRPRTIMLVLIMLLMLSMMFMDMVHPYAAGLGFLLMLWGASGWASIATQQKTLVEISPRHATISIALLSSINYLAGSIGTMSFGALLERNENPANLPYFTGAVLVGGLFLQCFFMYKTGAREASVQS